MFKKNYIDLLPMLNTNKRLYLPRNVVRVVLQNETDQVIRGQI